MTRAWCAGARLYADVWNNKGPLFYLWLRPSCLFPPTTPYTLDVEQLVFWLPALAVASLGVFYLARASAMTAVKGLVFGALATAYLWSWAIGSQLDTERLVAAFVLVAVAAVVDADGIGRRWASLVSALALTCALLCNWRAGAFLPLYFLHRPAARAMCRDAAAAFGVAVAICLAATAGDRESLYWLYQTTRALGDFQELPLTTKIDFFLRSFVSRSNGIVQVVFWPVISTAVLLLGSALCACFLIVRYVRRWSVILLSGAAGLIAIGVTGQVYDHAYFFLVPTAVVALSDIMTRANRFWTGCLAVWIALGTGAEIKRSVTMQFGLYQGASAEVLEYGRKTSAELSRLLAGRPWVSLLTNHVPVLLAPGVQLPDNRNFHNYCSPYPRWAEDEVMDILRRVPRRVALNASIAFSERCLPTRIVGTIRGSCVLVEKVPEGGDMIEAYDCPQLK